MKHLLSSLSAGLLLVVAIACHPERKKNTSSDSNSGGPAKVTTAPRPANADVWVDKIEMAKNNGGQPGEFTSSFAPDNRTIWCVINLNQPKAGTAVKFVWEAPKSSYVYNGKDSMTTDYTTGPDIKSVLGQVTYPSDWPTGSYRVEVYINGALDTTIDYTIE
jgi:hypothetical protein